MIEPGKYMTADYAVHADIVHDLSDARGELDAVIKLFVPNEAVDEEEFNWRMAHLYSHINSAWNKRNMSEAELAGAEGEQLDTLTRFPRDLKPL